MPGTDQSAGDITVNKTDQAPYPHGANSITNQFVTRIIADWEKFKERILRQGF